MPIKQTKRLSSISTLRPGTPSAPEVMDNFMNFMPTYDEQRSTRPKQWNGKTGFGPTNSSGRANTNGVGTALGSGQLEYPKQHKGATKV